MSSRFATIRNAYLRPGIGFAIGAVSLLLRVFSTPEFIDTLPRGVAMKGNSAVAFVMLGFALLVHAHRPKLARALAVLVALLGAATVAEYAFGWWPGLDQLFFADHGRDPVFSPGRMSLNTALAFACIGMATACLEKSPKNGARPAQILALVTLFFALPPAVVYMLGAKFDVGLAPYALMSLPSCLGFGAFCAAILRAHINASYIRVAQDNGPGRVVVRSLGPALIFVTLLVGWLVLRGERAGLYDAGFGLTISIIFNVMALVPIVFFGAISLNKSRAERDRIAQEREQAVVASEARHKELIESLPLMIWTADAAGKITFRNKRWHDFVGADATTALSEEDRAAWAAYWQRAVTAGEPLETEYRLRRTDGERLWHLIRAVPIKDAEGKVVSWLGTSIDVDGQRRSESVRLHAEALRASEEHHRAIVENAVDAVVSMDDQGRIVDWNHKAQAMFGWNQAEVIGRVATEIILPPEARHSFDKDLRRFLATGEHTILNRQMELAGMRRTGAEFPIQMSISPIPRGHSFMFTAFVEDITERKRAERELIDARQEALAAVKAKSAFLANMSHEIRTPLNGVIGMADLLLDTPLDDTQRRYARVMQDSGAGLLTIVNDILDFSKIEAGKLDLEMLDFNLASVVEGQAELLAGKAREKGLSLNVFVDPSLPQLLTGDAGRIGQILLNLIGNALKFTHKGSVTVAVTAPTRPEKEGIACHGVNLRFEVKDTGVGLAPQTQDRLFKPFVQADGSTARQFGGTGLGLSISKRLVELMGGEIGVISSEGKGSTFWFALQLSTSASDMKRHEATLAGARILIVDSDDSSRDIFAAYLRSWSIEAEVVASYESALAALLGAAARSQPFDVAVLDTAQGQDAAIAFATRLKATHSARSTRLVLTTAIGGLTHEARARVAGIRGFLVKPVKQSDLFDTLVDALHEPQIPAVKADLSAKPAGESGDKINARILVAEDNAVNQLLALTMLKKMGYTAIAVANGREAIEAWRLSPYDLILMDCQMPEVDGFEATRVIRAEELGRNRRIPIIALTANAMSEDRDKCLEAGMDDFVTKPVKRAALQATIERWRVPAPVDATILAALVEGVGEAGLQELLGLFLGQMPERFKTMRDALARGDIEGLGTAAHNVKSASGEFGATSLMKLLDAVEAGCLAQMSLAALSELLTQAEAEWARVERHFKSPSAAA